MAARGLPLLGRRRTVASRERRRFDPTLLPGNVALRGERADDTGADYFNTPPSSEATFAPPLAPTNCVSRGMNWATMSGERPSFWKAATAGARPPAAPGRAPPSAERPP